MVLRRGTRAVASIVRCWRVDPEGSPAALVAAWLIDVLASLDGVRLNSAEAESVVLDVGPSQCPAKIRDVIEEALAEPRFAGWQLLE